MHYYFIYIYISSSSSELLHVLIISHLVTKNSEHFFLCISRLIATHTAFRQCKENNAFIETVCSREGKLSGDSK